MKRPIYDHVHDREAALAILGDFSCSPAYRDRGLSSPDCVWCNHGEDVADALGVARSQGEEVGYHRESEAANASLGAEVCTEYGIAHGMMVPAALLLWCLGLSAIVVGIALLLS